MLDSGIPPTMWITATEAAIHVYNRTPHKSNEFKTPLSKICPEKKSHLKNIRRFGCIAYVKIPISENKFSESQKNYSSRVHSYRISFVAPTNKQIYKLETRKM